MNATDTPGNVRVGCYYFPNYHVDPRNEKVHGPGWTEWQLVKQVIEIGRASCRERV